MDTGRFAPSTTGPAHPGTLLAALLCWLDARSRGGRVVLRLEDLPTPEPGPGEVLVETRYLAVEPAMKGWMEARVDYVAPMQIGDVMRGSPGQRQSIERARAAADLIHEHEALRCRVIQYVCGLGHLDHERRATAR